MNLRIIVTFRDPRRKYRMTTSSQFLARLGTRLPIIQAPMAGVSTPRLAAEVSNAGALGSIGIGASSLTQAWNDIQAIRALTDHPFNVNVFCHQPADRSAAQESEWLQFLSPLFNSLGIKAPDHLEEIYKSFLEDTAVFELLLEQRPNVVSFHFGIPSKEKIKALQDVGVYTLATATNLSEAIAIQEAGIDALVAQGIEAGGHRGVFDPEADDEKLSTHVLVNVLTQHTQLPVIAAGGIMDGAGIRAALQLGAVAAQMGTAFVLCPESSANAGYRDNLRKHTPNASTRLTSALSGRPARGLVNDFITYCESPDAPMPAAYPLAYDAAKQLNAGASKQGNVQYAANWAGQGAPLARELPAALLIEKLQKEMAEA